MSIGTQIKARKKELRISNSKLCEMAGISARTLLYIQHGRSYPSKETLSKLCQALQCDWEILIKPKNK